MSSTRALVYLTARDSQARLAAQPAWGRESAPAGAAELLADPGHLFQEIEGFGGAFTEAAAVTLHKASPAHQEEILRAYFDPVQGLGYSLCRTHINSCDFSLGNYAHADRPGDLALQHFTIERDRRDLVPMIQAAQRVAGHPLKLFASPWSPPAWMKTNGEMNHGGSLRPECREAWAGCYVKFIEAYEAEGIPIWGLTVQNEPAAIQRWDSCTYTAEEERDFVRDQLGPALQRAGRSDVKLMVWDHNRDLLYHRVKPIYDDPECARFVWGAAFHWYGGDFFDNVQRVHDAWPDKRLVFTEGCMEGGPHLGEWAVGERYGASIVNDLNRWTVGWVDWNLLLDEQGGPNHVGNLCSAPILYDTRAGAIHYQSSYYYIGHFARFIRPGARRIALGNSRDDLDATAFRNPDGSVIVVAMNRTESPIPVSVTVGQDSVSDELPAHAIVTLVLGG
jgi:glucosylceramidase